MFHHYEDGLDSTNQKTCTITKRHTPTPAKCSGHHRQQTNSLHQPLYIHEVFCHVDFKVSFEYRTKKLGLQLWDHHVDHTRMCAFGVTLPIPWVFQKLKLSLLCMKPAHKDSRKASVRHISLMVLQLCAQTNVQLCHRASEA